jgi:hypothetical protein
MREVSALKFDPDLAIFHDDDNSVSSLQFDLNEPDADLQTPSSLIRRKAFITLLVGSGETDEVSKLLFPESNQCMNEMSSNVDVKSVNESSPLSDFNNSSKVHLNLSNEMENMSKIMDSILISVKPSPQEDIDKTYNQYENRIPDSKKQEERNVSNSIPTLDISSDSDSMKSFLEIEDDKSTCSIVIHKNNSPKCSNRRRKLWMRSRSKKSTKQQTTNVYKVDDKSIVSTTSTWSSKLVNIFRPKLLSKRNSKNVNCNHRLKHIREREIYDDDDSIVTSVQIQSELRSAEGKGVIENLYRIQQQSSFYTSNTFISDLDPSCSYSFASASSEPNSKVDLHQEKSSCVKDHRSSSFTLPVQKPRPVEHLNRSLSDTVDYNFTPSGRPISSEVKRRVKEKLEKREKTFKLFSKKDCKSPKSIHSEHVNHGNKNGETSTFRRERLLSDSSNDTSYPIIHMSSFSSKNNKVFDTPGKHSLASMDSMSPSNSKTPSKQGASHTRANSDPTMLSPSPYRTHQRHSHKRMTSLPISFSNDSNTHRSRACDQGHSNVHRTHRRADSLSSVSSDISCLSDSISVASSYVSYHDPCAKPSKIVKRSRLDLGAGDGDIWFEKIFVSKRTGKRRTFFVSLATGRKKSDEPPTGASKVLYLEDLEDMKEMNLPVPTVPPSAHLRRYASC